MLCPFACCLSYAGDNVPDLQKVVVSPIKGTIGDRSQEDLVRYIQNYFQFSPLRTPATQGTLAKVATAFGEPLWFRITEVVVQRRGAGGDGGEEAAITDAGIVVVPPGRADAPPTGLFIGVRHHARSAVLLRRRVRAGWWWAWW